MSGTQEVFTRTPRSERAGAADEGEAKGPELLIEEGGQISPEDAVAETKRMLAVEQGRTADARRMQREADERARRAEATAAQAVVARHHDRQTVVDTAISSANSELVSAKVALRAARDQGDIEQEITAQEAIAAATFRLQAAKQEQEIIKNNPPAASSGNPAARGPTAEVQRWIDQHPAFLAGNNRVYRGAALQAHEEALRAGHPDGSQSYVDYIDDLLTQDFGEGHGQMDGRTVNNASNGNRQAPSSRGSGGAPPSRNAGGANGNPSGYQSFDFGFGPVYYQNRPNGQRGFKMTEDQKIDLREGARICGYGEDDKALAAYVDEQLKAVNEVKAGERPTLIRGEGWKME